MKTDVIRTEVQRLIRQVPFQAFAMNLDNGDRVIVEHPENIAFDPAENGSPGSEDFYVISSQMRVFSTFEAVTSVMRLDEGA